MKRLTFSRAASVCFSYGVLLLLVCSSSAVFSSAAGEGDSQVEIVSEGTRAVPIHKKAPAYPAQALSRGIEGWVIVSFVVTPEGDTDEITVLESSAPGYFDQAAVRAVQTWKYKPATWNGVPVTEAARSSNLYFMIDGGQGRVTRRFGTYLSQAYAALEAEDLERVEQIIEKIEKQKKILLTEICYLDALKGDYWLRKQDPQQALYHFNRALVIADDVATTENLAMMLRKAVLISAQQGKLAKTLEYYDQLIEADPAAVSDETYSGIAQRVRQAVESSQPFATTGTVQQPCPSCADLTPLWRHQLLRRQFTLRDVVGEIHELKLLCGNNYVSLAFEADMVWDVNRDWGDCDLHVLGEAGSSFTLVELPSPSPGSGLVEDP